MFVRAEITDGIGQSLQPGLRWNLRHFPLAVAHIIRGFVIIMIDSGFAEAIRSSR